MRIIDALRILGASLCFGIAVGCLMYLLHL